MRASVALGYGPGQQNNNAADHKRMFSHCLKRNENKK
jgi:hypothetical protein